MSNIIQLHRTQAHAEPEWNGPEDIAVGQRPNGERLEIVIDRTDGDETLIIVPPTTFPGPVGYTLTNEQTAELAGSLYASMDRATRNRFQNLMNAIEGD